MTRAVFVCRESLEGAHLARALWGQGLLDSLIIEKGHTARRRKIQRSFKNRPMWLWPLVSLDLLAVAIYNSICDWRLRGILGSVPFPVTPSLVVDDVNDDRVADFLRARHGIPLVVCGTGIVRGKLISAGSLILNVHGGFVPLYRNVHSEFWAAMRGDAASIGTSILYLDPGIDSGDIALQRTINVRPDDTFLSMRAKNIAIGTELLVEALQLLAQGRLPRVKQTGESFAFRTPTLRDLWRFARLRLNEAHHDGAGGDTRDQEPPSRKRP